MVQIRRPVNRTPAQWWEEVKTALATKFHEPDGPKSHEEASLWRDVLGLNHSTSSYGISTTTYSLHTSTRKGSSMPKNVSPGGVLPPDGSVDERSFKSASSNEQIA